MQSIEIPQDIIEILRVCQYERDEYCDFDISLTVSREGNVVVRDLMGYWEDTGEDVTPENCWKLIRKWWENEQENIAATEHKKALEKQIAKLQKEVENLNQTAKKRKWFW